jgi:NitT/TauT family transport system permease protein
MKPAPAAVTLALLIGVHALAAGLIGHVWTVGAKVGVGFWLLAGVDWLCAIYTAQRLCDGLSPFPTSVNDAVAAVLFGIWLLIVWELVVDGFAVPPVLLPPPSLIGVSIAASGGLLLADFRQTFLKAALAGWGLGSLAGFLLALATARSPFLKKGLLPIGNLFSALPIVGVAPIMVMWFGFDWASKAAVVVVMTFFPTFINTMAGLDAAGRMERDLMRTYAATDQQVFSKLLLPTAAPYIFNALKINTTLAMIGAIVAEFFGTPIVGMGFRMSQAIGRLQLDLVWAEIVVAAIAGTAFYGLVGRVEQILTHWHPSQRQRASN